MSREILFTYNNNFSNEFINSQEGAADPFLIKVNGYYYLFFTAKKGLICFKSFDLLHFEKVNGEGHVDNFKDDVKEGYAPEVFYFNGYYYLICSPGGNGHYIFKSDSILGPFTKITDNIFEMIDGSFFVDSDEKIYLSRASETGIILKEFNDEVSKNTDFELFKDETVIKEAKIGRWNEGPFIIKRYGNYYLTYTGTHFLSSSYRVEYVSGNSLSNLKYKDVILLSNEEKFYGLGHSMTVLGPNLDSDYIVYHSMNDDKIRRFNISRLLFKDDKIIVSNPSLASNFNIERPDFETFSNEENVIFDYVTNNKFSIEFNLLGKNSKGIFGYKDENNYYSLYLENNHIILKNSKEIIVNLKLNREYNEEVLHNFRIQYKENKLVIYFDNMEFLINENVVLESGKIGYKNNKLKDAYIASSKYAFKDSDKNELYVSKTFVYEDLKTYDFYVTKEGDYLLSILGKEAGFYIDFEFLNDKFNFENNDLKLRKDFKIYHLKEGKYTLNLNSSFNVEMLLLKEITSVKKEIILTKSLETLVNFDVFYRYNINNYGILFENDRNAILSKNKFRNYVLETELKLLGNPVEDCDFVGLIMDVNNYGNNNSFESCYSLNGYIFCINSNYIYIIKGRYNHSKILLKLENNFTSNEFKLKAIKNDSEITFYLNDKELYKTIDNDIYIEGKVGIYNNHASGLFKYIKVKGE